MADLDTRNKRGSGIGVDLPFLRLYPNPDGTISKPDRQQTAWKYAGIAAAGGATFKAAWARGCNFYLKAGVAT